MSSRKIVSFLCAVSMIALSATPAQAQRRPRPPSEEQISAYLADKPPEVQAQYRSYMTEGERNAVLNLTRSGLAAMEVGADQVAATSFDQALERIEAVYADNETAQRARSNFVAEATKDFKGEPYERAMAYYYRGLLYLREGDYENARASFEGGQLQDTYAEDQVYQNDFALLSVLSGWASQCAGATSLAAESYEEARQALATTSRPEFAMPTAEDHILLVADLGVGPTKFSDGQYQENLRFLPAQNFTERAVLFASPEMDAAVAAAVRNANADVAIAQSALELAQAEVARLTPVAAEMPSLTEAIAAPGEAGVVNTLPPPVADAPKSTASQNKFQSMQLPGITDPAAATTPAAPEAPDVSDIVSEAAAASTDGVAPADGGSALGADPVFVAANEAVRTAQATLEAKQQVAAAAATLAASIGLDLMAPASETSTLGPPLPVVEAATLIEASASSQTADAAAAPAISEPTALPTPISGHLAENMYWQATTRGGRAIDGVLEGKANFRENATQMADTTSQLSSVAIQTANTMYSQAQSLMAQGYNVDMGSANAAAGIGLGLMAFSLASRMVAAATKPQADTRYWDNLPAEVHLAFVPTGTTFRASYIDAAGASVRTASATVRMDPHDNCGIAWVRSRSAVAIGATAPNSALSERRR